MIPVLSIEGGEDETDSRRGAGTHARIQEAIEELEARRILHGVSVTVSKENLGGCTLFAQKTAVASLTAQ